jgi:hypothetical protein
VLLPELAGLVVASALLGHDVHSVEDVDESDLECQSRELFVVVVLGRVRPGFVGDTAGVG